jgi:hypothetical protein
MRGAIPPFLQYALMAWCSVKRTGTTLYLPSKGTCPTHICVHLPVTLYAGSHIRAVQSFNMGHIGLSVYNFPCNTSLN